MADEVKYAYDEILSTYGDRVLAKNLTLHQFGRTQNANAGIKTTIAEFQGNEVQETYATGNTIDSVVSTSGSDTGVVQVEGHTMNLSTGHLNFLKQNVNLNGQTPVLLSTPLARADRIFATPGTFTSPASDLVGTIAVYDGTLSAGVTAGKPNVDSSVKVMITAGQNQSKKCAVSVSSTDYWIIDSLFAVTLSAIPVKANIDIDLELKELGGVWRPSGFEIKLTEAAIPMYNNDLVTYYIVPPNTDVRMVATSDTDNTTVAGFVRGKLALIQQ